MIFVTGMEMRAAASPLSRRSDEAVVNIPEARVAPFPKMHKSPVPQGPVPQGQAVEKPVLGYHPSVRRLFIRNPNVWVRQTTRDVALDLWEDFSSSNQPHENWAWEEYDPFNPIVWDMNGRGQRQAPGA
ncbi:IST1 protein [Cordyceps militaris]|uniref:IST1 protein n=1 Tax=Cordyceps militaris TaxID=73501 RepID=A0A2H4S5N1_CORMI|nr:IST1 protein [Cordyceps militaris]